ncbi:MAG: hypothetical protein H6696_15350 [Deferribacteres bacterium]|nr:hypothetical protein [candidate division KSB1 bacterium]MCB9503304.1 hypothetical protein [Deferribacteres bacterium]
MKNQNFKNATVFVAFAFFLSFFACDNKQITSPVASQDTALTQDINNTVLPENAQEALAVGPVSNEVAESIQAPEEKITRKEGELNIIKVETTESLQKRFITSWYVPRFGSGWAYAGDPFHGQTWLYFPFLSVSQDVIITIDWESTGLLEGGVEFSPHGTQFLKPVKIFVSYQDVDLGNISEDDLRLWYWNEEQNVWELIGDTVDKFNKTVNGELHHFSRYALGTE